VRWKRGSVSVGGFSLPVIGGGLSWSKAVPEKEIVRRLVTRLAERRVFSEIYEAEYEAYTNESVLSIRSLLTDAIAELSPGSEASRLLIALRDACNRYLTLTPDPKHGARLRPAYAEALQGLRETFRVVLVYLSQEGRLAEAGGLAASIPTHLSPDNLPMFLEGPSRPIWVAGPKDLPAGLRPASESDERPAGD
jgi:hypothetical protein